jgi:glutathione synthase/RimK-type ligase-like ATP-grasp enzyme
MPKFNIQKEDQRFAEREIGETLKSLWRLIDGKIWLNAPYRMLRASNKPEQLSMAMSIGFSIPETYIGRNIDQVGRFYKNNSGKIIAKAVKHGFNYDENGARVAATQKIDDSSLASLKDYASIPMIFQNEINKKYDIRVIVVDEQVFSIAIESQQHEETKIDWRLSDCYKIPLKQYEIKLPDNINSMCIEITKKFKLRYSAIDLVLDMNDGYYFLELNPNGQWAWIDQLGIHNIRDAIINGLQPTESKIT